MSDTSADSTSPRASLGLWLGGAGLMLLLPVLYVASTGPFIWLVEHNWISEPTAEYLQYVYTPLIIACEYSPLIQGLFEKYGSLWVP